MKTPFEKACDLVGATNLARELDVSPQAIHEWKKAKRPIPVERCTQIEQATNGAVTRKDLRPDDWEKIWPELSERPKKTCTAVAKQSSQIEESNEELRRDVDLSYRQPADPKKVAQ